MIIWTNSKWQPAWIYDRHDFSFLWSTSHPNASYRFESTCLSVQEKRRKIDFQDGCHGGHLGYPTGTNLAFFDLQVTPMSPTSLESIGLSVQEKKLNIDFQDGGHGGHLGFLIRTILAIFDLQVTLMLPTKFRVKWLLGLGEEAKNRFSRQPPWRPSWIYDRHDFSYFWSTSHPNVSYQVSSQLAFRFRRRSEK